MAKPKSFRIFSALLPLMTLSIIGFAQERPPTRYAAVLIQKDAQGRLSPAEAAQLQGAYARMGETSAAVWIAARVRFNPDIPPESAEGVAQQRAADHVIDTILARLERRVGVDTRIAERTAVGPYVALPLVREGIDELVADHTVELFYVLLPVES